MFQQRMVAVAHLNADENHMNSYTRVDIQSLICYFPNRRSRRTRSTI
jgi:hypothetical protein